MRTTAAVSGIVLWTGLALYAIPFIFSFIAVFGLIYGTIAAVGVLLAVRARRSDDALLALALLHAAVLVLLLVTLAWVDQSAPDTTRDWIFWVWILGLTSLSLGCALAALLPKRRTT